jgi:hypothetical protein
MKVNLNVKVTSEHNGIRETRVIDLNTVGEILKFLFAPKSVSERMWSTTHSTPRIYPPL